MSKPANLEALRFKALRNSRNYTVTEFAELLSITPGYVSRIERSHVPVSRHLRSRCEKLLSVAEDYFDTVPPEIDMVKKAVALMGVEDTLLAIYLLSQEK